MTSMSKNSKIAWFAYFVFTLVFTFYVMLKGYSSAASSWPIAGVIYCIPSVIQLLSLIGLYGFITNKAFGFRFLWIICFVFYALIVLLRVVFSISVVSTAAGIFFLALPLLYALFVYSFKAPFIWQQSSGIT